jgi:hypothetical protein
MWCCGVSSCCSEIHYMNNRHTLQKPTSRPCCRQYYRSCLLTSCCLTTLTFTHCTPRTLPTPQTKIHKPHPVRARIPTQPNSSLAPLPHCRRRPNRPPKAPSAAPAAPPPSVWAHTPNQPDSPHPASTTSPVLIPPLPQLPLLLSSCVATYPRKQAHSSHTSTSPH